MKTPVAASAVLPHSDVNAAVVLSHATQGGYTALMYACENSHEQCALALLKAGADRTKEVPGYAGLNAYKLAERAGHTVICDLLNVC